MPKNTKGKVVLVGAGPGDPGLLTLKGKHMLEDAEVVVYDRLVCEEILDYASKAKKINVGKEQSHHPVPQHEINKLLVDEAQQGKFVVRLKGGDPYLFGRGSEEVEELVKQGIAFEVVPGVTSAFAGPSYAGIPVTCRGKAQSVHVITGHARAGGTLDIDFDALCRVQGTLVFLMAVTSMPVIVKGLLEAGMASDTAVALVEKATLPEQRRVQGTLGNIVQLAQKEQVISPALLVVGEVCANAPTLDWFSSLPLKGKTVLVTRPKARAGTLSKRLRALGAQVISLPCIETHPAHEEEAQNALQHLADFSWLVLTSPQGVQSLFSLLEKEGKDARVLAPVSLAAVGSGTAQELALHGVRADYIPEHYDGVHLAQGLLTLMKQGENVLLLRAEKGTPELPNILQKHGMKVEDIALYKTVPLQEAPALIEARLKEGSLPYVTFTSASTVEGFSSCVPCAHAYYFTAVCIGDSTEAAAQARGYRTIKARKATIDQMIEAILEEENHE